MEEELAKISKLAFDNMYGEREISNISTYCKNKKCWDRLQEKKYELSNEIVDILITDDDRMVEMTRAKKDQRENNKISTEIAIFNLGEKKWKEYLDKGIEQKVLNDVDIDFLKLAINYCRTGSGCSTKQAARIWEIKEKLFENGIE